MSSKTFTQQPFGVPAQTKTFGVDTISLEIAVAFYDKNKEVLQKVVTLSEMSSMYLRFWRSVERSFGEVLDAMIEGLHLLSVEGDKIQWTHKRPMNLDHVKKVLAMPQPCEEGAFCKNKQLCRGIHPKAPRHSNLTNVVIV
jgi:hypothetical protein